MDLAERLIEKFDVRTKSQQWLLVLSGGNQQKANYCAWSQARNPSLLIAAPTNAWKLNVGAIEYIHKRLIDQETKEQAIITNSWIR